MQGCYPLLFSEKKLKELLEDYLIEKVAEMFGFQALSILEDSGMWYEEGEVKVGRVIWHHGDGISKEETFEITLSK